MARSTFPHFAGRGCFVFVVLAVAACGDADTSSIALDGPDVSAALTVIEPEMIEHHIHVLADDSLEGRAPGTRGYEGPFPQWE